VAVAPRVTIPYGRPSLDDEDVAAVVRVLRSEWLTTGPAVSEFEAAFAAATGSSEAVAVSSGTAALHAAMHALGVGPGDEVIVPTLTFAASANCVLFTGATPVFADVDPATLLVDPRSVESLVSPRTKAIIAVDYAGQPCDYPALRALADRHALALVADACHSLGGSLDGRPVGTLADLSCFSLHPVKHVTTGEGGVVTTADAELAARMRRFRNHGITSDHRERAETGSWFYEMVELGFNYRITDFQCALGTSQLRKLPRWIAQRQDLALYYDEVFADVDGIEPLAVHAGVGHAYHLYVVQVDDRDDLFARLRHDGIGANVHYVPVHLHPYYRERLGTGPGLCPVAEAAYERIISLPLFPELSYDEAAFVARAVIIGTQCR
jgi:perosamine synthetase